MNHLTSLILPACLGLFAGIGHGIVAHQADLPFSLTEQLTHSFEISQYPRH